MATDEEKYQAVKNQLAATIRRVYGQYHSEQDACRDAFISPLVLRQILDNNLDNVHITTMIEVAERLGIQVNVPHPQELPK